MDEFAILNFPDRNIHEIETKKTFKKMLSESEN